MKLGMSEAQKAIRALEKQRNELVRRRESLTQRLFEMMKVNRNIERTITQYDKLGNECQSQAKQALVKNDQGRARAYLGRWKQFKQLISRGQELGEAVEMMKGKVYDLDMDIREIEVNIEFVRAAGEIEAQAMYELGTKVNEATRKALEQTNKMADVIKTAKDMEKEGLSMKARTELAYSEDPDVEKEYERLSREVETEQVSEAIAEIEPEPKRGKTEE